MNLKKFNKNLKEWTHETTTKSNLTGQKIQFSVNEISADKWKLTMSSPTGENEQSFTGSFIDVLNKITALDPASQDPKKKKNFVTF